MSYNKKFLLVLLMSISMFLVSCNNVEKYDYGIITGFYIQDEQIHWDDVEGAIYYKLNYYIDFEERVSDYLIDYEICYVSHSVNHHPYLYDNGYLIVDVYYEDGNYETTDRIDYIYQEPEFPEGQIMGMAQFLSNNISLYSRGFRSEDYLNITAYIDGEEYLIESQEIALEDYFTEEEMANNVYEITVTVNYTNGISEESHKYYAFNPIINSMIDINVEYDEDSNEDLTFEFTEGEIMNISVLKQIIAIDGVAAPDGIFTINGSTVTVNKNFIQNPNENRIKAFYIYTENHVYMIWIK